MARAAKNAHSAATAAAGTLAGSMAGAAAGAAVGPLADWPPRANGEGDDLDKASEMAGPVVQRAFDWPVIRTGAEERFVNLFGVEKMPATVRRLKSILNCVGRFKIEVVEQTTTGLKRHDSKKRPLIRFAALRASAPFDVRSVPAR